MSKPLKPFLFFELFVILSIISVRLGARFWRLVVSSLEMTWVESFIYILIGFGLLVAGGEFLVRASVSLSFKLKLSRMVIGLTVVSFATSAPELIVSVQAALDQFSAIALGNVIGSNIANIGLVLGVTALIAPLMIDQDFYRFNWPVMVILSIVLFLVVASGEGITRIEGGVLFACLVVYLWLLIRRTRKSGGESSEEVNEVLAQTSNMQIGLWLVLGGGALWGGSELLVKGAVDMATAMGVSRRVIAITMIAIGTSVPELAASVIAALKKEKAISLGNLIGSNIFNIASVLGITAMIDPVELTDPKLLQQDIYWMLGFAFLLLPLALIPKRFIIGRWKGVFILAAYIAFLVLSFV